MPKRIWFGVGVLVFVCVLGGALRFSLEPARAQSEDPRLTELGRLMYPAGTKITGSGVLPGDDAPPQLFHTAWTTSDDVDKVMAHYGNILKQYHPDSTKKLTDIKAGQTLSENFKGRGWCCRDDSTTEPGGKETRGVTVRVITSYAAKSAYTLVITRGKDEDKTHLVLTYHAR